ncbi:MAG: RluA family pseudouridine synthase [Janthinobacterium lividum]
MTVPPILFRDIHFVVLDKPAGLPVHPGPRGGASIEDCFPLLSKRKDGPWLAHRLDTDTAGCLVVALRKTPLIQAQACFAEGRASKTYWAIVSEGPEAETGTIDRPIAKHVTREGWTMRADPKGQPAHTEWTVLGRAPGLAWVELRLLTGRTHQARVHCALAGWPILGDPIYGPQPAAVDRLHLLARSILLPLDPPVSATAQPPAHMIDALRACGYRPA